MFRALLLFALLHACAPTVDPWDDGATPFSIAEPAQRPPPGGPITLTVSPLLLGRTATWTVTGLNPGELAYIGRSAAGPGNGPCPPVLGGVCLGLRNPVVLHATVTADAAGVAVFSAWVPPTVPGGITVAFQAAAARGASSVVSPVVSQTVVEPQDAGGVSGLAARPANPTCVAGERPQSNLSLSLTRVYNTVALNLPTTLIQPPGDNSRWFVGELAGRVKRFPNQANPAATTALDISARVVSGGELGLLGMAFDPDFATNGYLYVSYTGGSQFAPVSRISRFTSTNGGQTFDPNSEVIVLSINQPYSNHNGGNIVFGPDGYLYAGFGDGGSANDPGHRAQNPNVLLGKFLRINVAPNGTYTIPPDNPYAGGGGAGEVWTIGMRNPWRWSFDSLTGALWAGDVGQDHWEEVDVIEGGQNYGWRMMEGFTCANPPGCFDAAFTPPVYAYPHVGGGSASIIGGYVYRGSAIPALYGTYLFAEFYTGEVFGLVSDGAGGVDVSTVATQANMQTATFAEDQDGELYVADYQNRIWRITQPAPPAGPVFPQHLSETGCFDPADPTIPAAGLIPYEPRAPLWSDGLEKRRWLALPDGETVTVGPDGDWQFPIGTVLAKEFSWQGAKVETRLLMRHTDGDWGAYTYVWDGADATLTTSGRTLDLGGGKSWDVPSTAQCFECHTAASDWSLGLETAQLNSDLAYSGGVANQINTLDAIGMFTVTPGEPATLPALPLLGGPDTAEAQSRAYLHSNCSTCHRPGANRTDLDLRYDTPFVDTHLCNVAPVAGDLGVPGALRFVPGDPASSLLALRMEATDVNRMPLLGSTEVHADAVDAVTAWIQGTTACP